MDEKPIPRWRVELYLLRDNLTRVYPEKASRWLAWHLPWEVVLWCMVRIAASVWQENVEPDKITYPMMHKTWEARRRRHTRWHRN